MVELLSDFPVSLLKNIQHSGPGIDVGTSVVLDGEVRCVAAHQPAFYLIGPLHF